MKKNDDSYVLTVKFHRCVSEDGEVVEKKFKGKSLQEKLVLQLRDELQEACDKVGLAGFFNIVDQPRFMSCEKAQKEIRRRVGKK